MHEKIDAKAFSSHIRQTLDWHFDKLDWRAELSTAVRENFRRTKGGKKTEIYGRQVVELLKAIRNKFIHFHETVQEVEDFGQTLETFWNYWEERFPHIIPLCYQILAFDHDMDVDYFEEVYGFENAKVIAQHAWRRDIALPEKLINHRSLKMRNVSAGVIHASWKPNSNSLVAATDDKLLTFWSLTVILYHLVLK